MSKICECCGQNIPDKRGLYVDLDLNCLFIDGVEIKLRPQQAEICDVLLAKYPRVATYDFLYKKVFGWSEGPDVSSIKVQICHLRKHLLNTKISIKTIWGRGYVLVFSGDVHGQA